MRIEVTWNRPDGTQSTVGFETKADAPDAADEEMQISKAMGGAMAHFQHQTGKSVPVSELSYRVIRD